MWIPADSGLEFRDHLKCDLCTQDSGKITVPYTQDAFPSITQCPKKKKISEIEQDGSHFFHPGDSGLDGTQNYIEKK